MMLIATNFGKGEFDKAKAASFADTVIMKPLRASMVAACLQQVLGIGKKRQQGKELPNGSNFLQSLLSGKKILVVDDNMVNRRVAAGALKKFRADVVCVDSGKAALNLLQIPHNFDACFMDIQMPEMDGYVSIPSIAFRLLKIPCLKFLTVSFVCSFEATRRIRQMESMANGEINGGLEGVARNGEWHVPVLAMTADVIHATYDECLKCGMDGYVSKPFEEENLYQAVAKFFKSKPDS